MPRWGVLLFAGICLAQSPREIEVGRGIFRIYCSPCHGIRAQGGRGPDLSRGTFASGERDDDLVRTISKGVPGTEMAAFASDLDSQDILRIVAYLRSIGRHDTAPPPGDAARGASVFWGKGLCGQCHTVGGRGGRGGPDLTRVGRQRSLGYLRQSVVEPDADITPGFRTVRVVQRDGTAVTGIEKGLDNFSVQLLDLDGRFYSFDKDQVASVTRETRSLMPQGYANRLTPEELTDLLAYLAGLRGTEAKP